MGGMRTAAVVSSQWLKHTLKGSPKYLRVLDTSWSPKMSGKEDFLKKRIPGAQFWDQNQCVQSTPMMARTLPDATCFTKYLRSLGVDHDAHVVLYDQGGMVAAARAWWTMRAFGHFDVSVLNGGLSNWESEGNNLDSGESPQPQKQGDFKVDIQGQLIAEFRQMINIHKDQSAQVLDARNPKNFLGCEAEPSQSTVSALEAVNQPVPATMGRGHIRGAINMPSINVINQDLKLLHQPDQLKQVFSDFGVDLERPLVTMCYNGNAACLLALAAHTIGKTDAQVYYGSFTEYGQRASSHHLSTKSDSRSSG